MKDDTTHELAWIADTVAGEVPVSNASTVEPSIASSPDRLRTVKELVAAKDRLRSDLARSNRNGSASRVIEHVLQTISSSETSGHARPANTRKLSKQARVSRLFSNRLSSYAVALFAILVVVVPTMFVALKGAQIVMPTATIEQQYVTGVAERVTVELADGSRITLAPESRLIYGVNRTHGRRVILNGRAMFQVQARSDDPFIVEANNALVQVLGTEFVVSSYSADSIVQVAVQSGKVALRTSATRHATGTALAAGDLGTLDRDGLVTVTKITHMDRYASWASDRLQFTRAPLSVIVRELSLKYGVRVDVDTSFANVLVTASFTTESLADALASLAAGVRGKIAGGSGLYRIIP